MTRATLAAASENQRPQLIAARERLHLSQQEVADKIGVSKATIHRWEKQGDIPQPFHLRQLCDLYGVSARELGFAELTADVQTVTALERMQEPDNHALEAFRQRHMLGRLE